MAITWKHSPYWLVLFIVVAAILTYFHYRRTHPPLPAKKRWLLASLRFTTWLLVLLLFLEILFILLIKHEEKPVLVLLQDNSRSLIARKDSMEVKTQYPKQWQSFVQRLQQQRKDVMIVPYLFGHYLKKGIHVDFSEEATNISKALEVVAERYEDLPLQGIVLATDGIYNEGYDPLFLADKLSVPIYTLLLGDTTTYKDCWIAAVDYNPVAYLDTEVPIIVHIQQQQFAQQKTIVRLWKDGKLQKQIPIILQEDETLVEWYVPLQKEGLHHWVVELVPLKGEFNKVNNYYHVYIRVLRAKIQVVCIAGSDHPDLAAFRRTFSKDARFQYQVFIKKRPNQFYRFPNDSVLQRAQVVILHNFPQSPYDKPLLLKLQKGYFNRQFNLMVVVGKQTAMPLLMEVFGDMLPLTLKRLRRQWEEAQMALEPSYKVHSTFPPIEDFDHWVEGLPPLLIPYEEWKANPQSHVFAYARIKGVITKIPLLAFLNQSGRRCIQWIGEGLWQFRLYSYLAHENFDYFDQWFLNLIQWLSVHQKGGLFLRSAKQQYQAKQRIWLYAHLRDESLKPVEDAEIKLVIKGKDFENQYFMQPQGRGNYVFSLEELPSGTYQVYAEAYKAGKRLGSDQTGFVVGQTTQEYLDFVAKANLLRQLALRTSGKSFMTLNDLEQFLTNQWEAKAVYSVEEQVRGLHQWLPWLLLILLFLSAEWFLRRFWGLL